MNHKEALDRNNLERMQKQIQRLQHELDVLISLSATDPLTGLATRWEGSKLVNDKIREGECGVFVVIDIDHFTQINKKFGHQTGDALLKALGHLLREMMPHELVMRLNGDEFAFQQTLDSTVDIHLFRRLTMQLFERVNAIQLPEMGHYRISISVGAVYYQAHNGQNFDDLYSQVAELCHQAKRFDGNYLISNLGRVPDVRGAFETLREDRLLYNETNDRLFHIDDEEDWMAYQRESADLKQDMCQRNQQHMEQIMEFYNRNDVLPEDYDMLYDLVLQNRDSLDPFMVEQMAGQIMLPHYESISPRTDEVCGKLAKLHLHLGDCYIGMRHMGDEEAVDKAIQHFKASIEVSRSLRRGTPEYEWHIYAICHLIGHFDEFGLQSSTSERDRLYEQLRDILMGPDAVTLKDPILTVYYEYLLRNARLYPLMRIMQLILPHEKTDEDEQELRDKLAYVKLHVHEGRYDFVRDDEDDLAINHLLITFYYSGIGYREMFEITRDKLFQMYGQVDKPLSTSQLTTATYIILGYLLTNDKADFTSEEKEAHVLRCWDLILSIYRRHKKKAMDNQTIYLISVMVRVMIQTPYVHGQKKLSYMAKSLAVMMTDTYSHCKAVAEYARIVTQDIIDCHPEMLVGISSHIQTVADVKRLQNSILHFMEQACLFHDVGKLLMTPIISNSYRKLTDHEFDLLKKHPEIGRNMFCDEYVFSEFWPIILGHHKWYDGTAGYPTDLDLQGHPDKILVDIVSFCDSLEAATSRIGRNYRRNKQFCQILDEFYEQAGTRYNPDVLMAITHSIPTYNRLKQMVEENWKTIYHDIYQEIAIQG